MKSALLALNLLQLGVEVAVHQEGGILPAVFAYPVQLYLDDDCVVFAACAVQGLLHFSPLQEVVAGKLLIGQPFHVSKGLVENSLSV